MFRLTRLPLLALALALPALPALSANHLVSDWEDRAAAHSLGGNWYYVTDESSQGESRILTGDTVFHPTGIDSSSFAPGAGGSSSCLQMGFVFGAVKPTCGDSCFYDQEVSIEGELASDSMPWVDFTGSEGVTFQAKADKPMKVRFYASTSEVMDYAYYGTDLDIGTEWKAYTIGLDSSATFDQPSWKEASVPFNKTAVTGFAFLASKENNAFDAGTFFLDDVKILNWEKPAGVHVFRAARKALKPSRIASIAGGFLKVQIPAAQSAKGGRLEVRALDGTLVSRTAFRQGEKSLRIPMAGGARKIVLRFIP